MFGEQILMPWLTIQNHDCRDSSKILGIYREDFNASLEDRVGAQKMRERSDNSLTNRVAGLMITGGLSHRNPAEMPRWYRFRCERRRHEMRAGNLLCFGREYWTLVKHLVRFQGGRCSGNNPWRELT